MASNRFGNHFAVTTWGETHGPMIGCVIDGCPAGLLLTAEDIDRELALRRPGTSHLVSERNEPDRVEIVSGLFEGQTTGAPILLIIHNKDADPSKYEPMKELYRPGHANFTYLQKYGVFDWRGSGRASARETAARVAAGAVAQKLLQTVDVKLFSRLIAVGGISDESKWLHALEEAKNLGDSIGGVVECIAENVPAGLGDPIYEKIEAKLASAMMSLPASKAFEIGEGVKASAMKGSEHNDQFCLKEGNVGCKTNHAGGTLGGITTGEPLIIRVHFKPTASIKKAQSTVNLSHEEATLVLPEGSRHDPCVAIRAAPCVKAMCALVLADCLLASRLSKK